MSKKLESISKLRNVCQSPYWDPKGPLSETFNRLTYYKISIYFTWMFLHTIITPNQVTLLGLIVGLLGCVFITLPSYLPIIGVILFQFWTIFDMVDGEIARYKNICSLSGAFFDRLNTTIVESYFILALSYSVYLKLSDWRVFIFGSFALIATLLLKIIFSYLHIAALEPILHRKHSEMFDHEKLNNFKNAQFLRDYLEGRPSSLFFKLAEFLIGYGVYIGLYCAVMLDVLLNYSLPILSFNINFSYFYLICLGTILPIGIIYLIIYMIKNQAPEWMYFSIIQNFKQGKIK